MANFTQTKAAIDSANKAMALLPYLQEVYRHAQQAQTAINLYNAGTEPAFNTAVNQIFTAGERAQLATMLGNLNTLVNAWAANHATLLGTQS